MHNLDRVQLEGEQELEFGHEGEHSANEQFLGDILGAITGGEVEVPLNESQELELASALLEVGSEQELEQFLGDVFRTVGRNVGQFVRSDTGRALGGMLKDAARQALPVVGQAVADYVSPGSGSTGASLAQQAGSLLGLELEGLSPPAQEFEAARQFVRLAGAAAHQAAAAPRNVAPQTAARAAVVAAAHHHAPGLAHVSHGQAARAATPHAAARAAVPHAAARTAAPAHGSARPAAPRPYAPAGPGAGRVHAPGRPAAAGPPAAPLPRAPQGNAFVRRPPSPISSVARHGVAPRPGFQPRRPAGPGVRPMPPGARVPRPMPGAAGPGVRPMPPGGARVPRPMPGAAAPSRPHHPRQHHGHPWHWGYQWPNWPAGYASPAGPAPSGYAPTLAPPAWYWPSPAPGAAPPPRGVRGAFPVTPPPGAISRGAGRPEWGRWQRRGSVIVLYGA